MGGKRRPFDQVQWKQEEHFIIGGAEEQNDPEHDGFLMMEQLKALHFESDKYSDCAGYLGYITSNWNTQGTTHASGLKLLSLMKGDVVAMSFPLARNVADDIAQKFSEEEYQNFAIGQKMRRASTDDVTCGVFDARFWQDHMPKHFKSSDTVYLAKTPDIIKEVFDMNGCQQSDENYDLMTAAAAGMLEGYSLQTLLGESEEKDFVGENWHKGMLDFLGAGLLPMVTTAYERASKKMRSAFIYQLEMNTGKHSQVSEGEREIVFPGDVLAETVLKFVEATIGLPETRGGIDPTETKEEMADNRKRAAVSIEHVCCYNKKQQQPTLEQIAEGFRNLRITSTKEEDASKSIVNPLYTEWIQRVIDDKIERRRPQFDKAVKEEGANVKLLSLGVAPLLSEIQREKIQQYEELHEALRAVPDRHEKARLELYASNVSQSGAASHDRSRAAIATRRIEAGGAAKTEVAKRSRRLVVHRDNLKKRRKDVENDLNAARLLEQDGKETFSKFRTCCNTPSKLKNKDGEFINYLGFEDRWQNDLEYRLRPSTKRDLPDKNAALHRDSQAALFFQDNFMNPYDPDVQIKELLMMARIWIRCRADEHAEKQEALTRAWAKAESCVAPGPGGWHDFRPMAKYFVAPKS